MKIVFLTPTLELYGGNIVLSKHADYLVKQGHDVIIVTTTKPVEVSMNKNVKIIQYPHIKLKYLDYFTFQALYYRKIIKSIPNCDLIIPIYTPLLLPAILAKKSKRLKAKLVLFFQDPLNAFFVGPLIKLLIKSKAINNQLSGVVTVSPGVADEYQRLANRKAKYIPIGIDEAFFNQKLQKKEKYLLFVGRPIKPKGYQIFRSALEIINIEFPDIVGKVATPKTNLRNDNLITFVINPNKEKLALMYGKALIHINSSLAECFPAPPLEAMASGTATIISNTGGINEYAKNGDNSFIVECGNVNELITRIRQLILDRALRGKFEKVGPKIAAEYAWHKANKLFLDYILRV